MHVLWQFHNGAAIVTLLPCTLANFHTPIQMVIIQVVQNPKSRPGVFIIFQDRVRALEIPREGGGRPRQMLHIFVAGM